MILHFFIKSTIKIVVVVVGDAWYLKAFEQQSTPDAETLRLTYLVDLACWRANESNQSPTEAQVTNCNHL